MNIFKEVADIKTADMLNLPTPEVEYHNIVSEPTEFQQAMVKELSKRAEKVHSGIDPHIDNMLRITLDGRKLGLDQRIINPMLPDEPGTKVNKCVANVLRIWKEGDNEKLTQLIFCDIATPSGKPNGDEKAPFTNIYDDIRRKLIAGGMAPEQVAFIHSANTDVQKKELFSKVRSVQVRVLRWSSFFVTLTRKMVSEYRDYLDMCHKMSYDMKNSFVLYPKDLQKSHDRTARRFKQRKDALVKRDFISIYQQLSGQLDFEKDGLKIVYPATPDDVVKEGHALHHCVGSYTERVAEKECIILFLRKCSEEEKSFYTIEVRNRKAVQVRGIGNCDMTPEIESFIAAWERRVLSARLPAVAA